VEICEVEGCKSEVALIIEDKREGLFHSLCQVHAKQVKKAKKLNYKTTVGRKRYLLVKGGDEIN
jgi:hypothetical protein